MLDCVQAGTGRKHPAGEDTLDFALQRHFVDFDKGVGVRRLGRRPRITHARRHLQRTELHGLVDGDVERDDAAGDLVEAGEHRGRIGNALRRRLDHDFVAGLRRGIGRLRRRAARLLLTGWQPGQGARRGRGLRCLAGRRGRRDTGRRRQRLRLDTAAAGTARWRQTHRRRQRLRRRLIGAAGIIRRMRGRRARYVGWRARRLVAENLRKSRRRKQRRNDQPASGERSSRHENR